MNQYTKYIITTAVLFLTLCTLSSSAQIGINTESPAPSAVLDIRFPDNDPKGFLIPSMTSTQRENINNPAHSLIVYDTNLNCISQNIGTEAVPIWKCLTLFNRSHFYMPSINIETKNLGAQMIDLYAEYKRQFSNPMYLSTGAPSSIPYFDSPTSLGYYITYHDPNYISIDNISASGVLNYTIIKQANYDTYINIVFTVR